MCDFDFEAGHDSVVVPNEPFEVDTAIDCHQVARVVGIHRAVKFFLGCHSHEVHDAEIGGVVWANCSCSRPSFLRNEP